MLSEFADITPSSKPLRKVAKFCVFEKVLKCG